MPSNNWHPITKTGAWITLAAVVFGCLWLLKSHAERGLEDCRNPRTQPHYAHRDKTYPYQTLPDGRIRAPNPFQSAYKRLNCDWPQSKEDYENCQQWRSAEYTAEQACIATVQFWVGSVIGIFGLGGLILTLYFANRSVNTATESSQRALRAYVLFKGGKVIITEDPPEYRVNLDISNGGDTPAWNLTHSIDSKVDIRSLMKDDFVFSVTKRSESLDLSPGRDLPHRKTVFPLTAGELADLKSGTKCIWVWGRLYYRDVYQLWSENLFRAVTDEPFSGKDLPLRIVWMVSMEEISKRLATKERAKPRRGDFQEDDDPQPTA